MGNLLVAPITEKETHRGVTEDGMEYAVSSMQGWRVHMEDAHITEGILYAEEPIIEDVTNNAKNGNGDGGNGTNTECATPDINSNSANEHSNQVNHHLSKKAKTTGDADAAVDAADQKESPALTFTTNSTSTSRSNSSTSNVVKYNRIKLEGHSLFSVFDGHGGSFAAEYAGLNFARVLCRQPAFVKYAHFVEDLTTREAMIENMSEANDDEKKMLSPIEKAQILRQGLELLEEALKDAFLDLDREIWREVQGYGNADAILPEKKSAGTKDNDGSGNSSVSGPNDQNNNGGSHNQDDDEAMHHDAGEEDEWQQKQDSGTTAIAVIFTPQWIICSNAGDSRSVYSKQGNCTIPLSYDHKPDDEAEERRIYDAGGFVRGGRVEGDLAVSRGLGDFRFKEDDIYRTMGVSPVSYKQYNDFANGRKKRGEIGIVGGGNGNVVSPSDQKVSPVPDIIVQNRDLENDEFVVVACDGIFDVQSNNECVALTADIMKGGEGDLGLVCEEILDECLEKGSKDNMTALVIKMPAQTIGEGGGVAERRRMRKEAAEQAEA